MAFSTAMIITPTSAKIASHMLARPRAPRARQSSFTPMAKTIFWYTIRRHFREILIALEIFRGIVVHQDNVRRFDRGVGSHGSHGDTDIRPAQNRRVVDPVAHKGKFRVFPVLFSEAPPLSPLCQLEEVRCTPRPDPVPPRHDPPLFSSRR